MQFGSALGDLGCKLASSLQVMKLGASVKVHHLRVHLVIVVHLGRLHGLVHHRGDLEHLLDGKALSLVQPLWIQSETGFLGEQGADLLDKLNTVVTLVNIIRDVCFWIVAQRKPVEDVGDEGKVRLTEVPHGDVATVTKGA